MPRALYGSCIGTQLSKMISMACVPSKLPPAPVGGGFDGTERAGTRSDGCKHGRNSADGCDEDRA